MQHDVLNPCPICGKRFDFPLTGCMTFVDEYLTTSTGGKCPNCGKQVVVDSNTIPIPPVNNWFAELSTAERRKVGVVDFPISVRCRATLNRLGISTFGELIACSKRDLLEQLRNQLSCWEEIDELLSQFSLDGNEVGERS